MKKMIEVYRKWYEQHKEGLFAVLSMIFAIMAFVCMYVDWKISVISAVISLITPYEPKEETFYYIRKYGRILSRMILLMIIIWICVKFTCISYRMYIVERTRNIDSINWSTELYPHEKKFAEYWYVIPKAFVELIKEIC